MSETVRPFIILLGLYIFTQKNIYYTIPTLHKTSLQWRQRIHYTTHHKLWYYDHLQCTCIVNHNARRMQSSVKNHHTMQVLLNSQHHNSRTAVLSTSDNISQLRNNRHTRTDKYNNAPHTGASIPPKILEQVPLLSLPLPCLPLEVGPLKSS